MKEHKIRGVDGAWPFLAWRSEIWAPGDVSGRHTCLTPWASPRKGAPETIPMIKYFRLSHLVVSSGWWR